MKRNAFTLIELLAVIVILAIIALIAVPIVINIIDDSKDKSIKRSIKEYLDTTEKTITKENLKSKYNPDECIIQEDSSLICSENGEELITSDGMSKLKIDLNGTKLTNGILKINNGKVIEGSEILILNNYYSYSEKDGIKKVLKQAGLFNSENELIVSWDDLINIYKLDVEKDYSDKNSLGTMYYLFNNNNQLSEGTKLVIAEGTTKIGDLAFYGCENLINVTIPSSVVSIGESSFDSCTNLTNLIIEKNSQLENFGSYAFADCTNLTSINIPNKVTNIDDGVFAGCESLINVTFEKNIQLENIGEYAFSNCASLANIIIPNTVENIGEGAFSGCENLTKVNLPDNLLLISDNVFEDCINLTSITIPSSVTNIGSYSFYNSGLTSINIPSSVNNIGNQAFCTGALSTAFLEVNTGWKWYNIKNGNYSTGQVIDFDDTSTNKNAMILRLSCDAGDDGAIKRN